MQHTLWIWISCGLCLPLAASSDSHMERRQLLLVKGYVQEQARTMVPKVVGTIIYQYLFLQYNRFGKPATLKGIEHLCYSQRYCVLLPPSYLGLLDHQDSRCIFKLLDWRQDKVVYEQTYGDDYPTALLGIKDGTTPYVLMCHEDRRFSCLGIQRKTCRSVTPKLRYAPHTLVNMPYVNHAFLCVGGTDLYAMDELTYWCFPHLDGPITSFEIPTKHRTGVACIDAHHFAVFLYGHMQKVWLYRTTSQRPLREIDFVQQNIASQACYGCTFARNSIFVGPWIVSLFEESLGLYNVWQEKTYLFSHDKEDKLLLPLHESQFMCVRYEPHGDGYQKEIAVYGIEAYEGDKVGLRRCCVKAIKGDSGSITDLVTSFYVLGGSVILANNFFQKMVCVYPLE